MNTHHQRAACKYAFFAICLSVFYTSALSAPLCAAHEKVLFSCELKNKKTVSICVSSDSQTPYVQYNFGKHEKLELTHRSTSADNKEGFHRADIIFGNNAVDTIWFKSGQHIYDIFMPARGAPAVEVWTKTDILAHIDCADGWTNVEGDTEMKSPLILDHGEVNVTDRKSLWFGK